MKGHPFTRNGITLLSGHDPVSRCEKVADAVSIRDRTLYFCPSPVYGYGLARLLSRLETEAPNSAVLCIEADGELYDLAQEKIAPLAAADKKLRLTNICDAAGLYAFMREAWGARTFRRIEIIKLTGGWQLFPELYDSLYEILRHEIAADWSNVLTLVKLGRLYIRNYLKNLSMIPHFPSIAELSFGEAPVLVFGAGPSLDETLDTFENRYPQMLYQKDNRPFKIICVDTCLGALKDRNIIPDLVIILESQHWNLHDFIGCKGWNVPAAIDLSALPLSAQMLSGEKFLFMTPWTNLRIFERFKNTGLLPLCLPPLGSVGNTAVELARRISRGIIICCGLDFSFTADKYHARSTPGHRSRLNRQTRFDGFTNIAVYDTASFQAVSKSGSSVRSSPVMRNYRNLFEQEFSSDPRLFDITGSGLPLGLKTLSLNEALSLLDKPVLEPLTQSQRFPPEDAKMREEKLRLFIYEEKKRLLELRGILTGGTEENRELLYTLIDECDYLWAHFPDSRRPDFSEIFAGSPGAVSFLKRMRAEIDPMINLLEKNHGVNT